MSSSSFAGAARRWRPAGARRGAPLGCVLVLLVLGHGPAWAALAGRPLVDVLELLERRGLNLIYSTAVVSEDLVVSVEPRATRPRAMLEEILTPLGLEARDGPGDSILIVRRAPSGRLRGRVVSAGRGSPVVRATVAVPGAAAQAVTRPDGTFEIPGLHPGEYEVRVGAPGFAERTLGAVEVRAGPTPPLIVELEARPDFVEEIVVTPGKHALIRQEQAAAVTVAGADAVLAPTIGGDVTRVIELLPGVAAADHSAAFNVRGSTTRDVALVFDGLELYQPFHLQGFQNPFSYIDSEIVETIDFFGGGFTVEFGDRHGGFVELTTAAPAEPRRTRLELGTLNGRVSYGTPLRSGSFMLSARVWYPEEVRHTTELGKDGLDPSFEDAYLNLLLNVSPRTVLSAHALLASDRLRFREADGAETVDADDSSGYLWLRLLNSWSPAVFSETILSGGRFERDVRGTSEPEDEVLVVEDLRTVDFLGLRHDATWQVSDSHLLRAGLDVRPLVADYRYTVGPEGDTDTRSLRADGTSLAVYLAHRVALSEDLATEVGLRWDRQTFTNDGQLSPRFNAVWRADERSELRLGLGRFHQSQRIHELRIEDGETDYLRAERSRQVDLTFQHRFAGGLRLRLDAYDRSLSRIHPRYENLFNPIELYPATEEDRVLVAPTSATLRGVEVLLRGDPERRFVWWANYAWSVAEDRVDGRDVPRAWDQTHAGKFLAAWRWKRDWFVSLVGTAHTGWPTTPVSAERVVLPDNTVVIEPVIGPRNSIRLRDYVRFDLKASRTFDVPRGRLRLDLEVVNLTDNDNVCCVDDFVFEERPDGTVDVRRELVSWLGITPSFSVVWEF